MRRSVRRSVEEAVAPRVMDQDALKKAREASMRYQSERMVEQRRRIVEAEAKPTYAERVDAWMALAADRLLSEEMGFGYPTAMAQVWATMHLAEVMERKA